MKLYSSVVTALLVGVFAIPALASHVPGHQSSSSEPAGEVVKKVSTLLDKFEAKAAETRREASELESLARNRKIYWQTHNLRLSSLSDNVNELGALLHTLESHATGASSIQKQAIAAARPFLVSIDDNLEAAIRKLNAERGLAVSMPSDYQEHISRVATSASEMYETVDTITDYKKAKNRLMALNVDAVPQSVN